MQNYSIGGQEVPGDANEAIQEISQNKTLLVQKLTADPPVKPEIVKTNFDESKGDKVDITTIDKVFEYFKPKVEVEFENSEGETSNEKLTFSNLGDFGKKGITNQSKYLNDLHNEQDQYLKMIKQLKSNKILNKALGDPDAKAAIIKSIESLLAELQQA